MIEEAAGLGRFKRQRHRAELKLARVAQQVDRARDVEDEVRKRLRPLALQATAAERRRSSSARLPRCARGSHSSTWTRSASAWRGRGAAHRCVAGASRCRRAVGGRAPRADGVEEELTDAAGHREQATALALPAPERHRAPDGATRVDRRLSRFTADSAGGGARRRGVATRGASRRPLRRQPPGSARSSPSGCRSRARLAALERSLAEREGIPPAAARSPKREAARALAARGRGGGRARRRRSAPRAWLRAGRRGRSRGARAPRGARAAGLGSLTVVTRVPDPLREVRVVAKDELLSSDVPAVTREGFGFDPQRGELWFAGETAEAVLLELEARRRELIDEVARVEAELTAAAARAAEAQNEGGGGARRARRASIRPARSRDCRPVGSPGRSLGLRARRCRGIGARLERRSARGSTPAATGPRSSERRCAGSVLVRSSYAGRRRRRRSARALSRSSSRGWRRRRRRRAAGSDEAGAEPAEGDDREELAEKVDRLERRRIALGQVNPLAKQEYEAPRRSGSKSSRHSAPISSRAWRSWRSCGPISTRPSGAASRRRTRLSRRTSPRSRGRSSRAARAAAADRAGGRGRGSRDRGRAAPRGQAGDALVAPVGG